MATTATPKVSIFDFITEEKSKICMRKLELKEIQAIELSVLQHFDEFCRQHEIKYFLSNGTLLGAVKYKGFIPWDDDIDVFVPREYYNRLIAEYPKDGKWQMLCRENNEHYPMPFAKLSDSTTVIKGQTRLNTYEYGVHIDILPLDYFASNVEKAKKEARKIRGTAKALCASFSYFTKGKTALRTVAKSLIIACARIFGHAFYRSKLEKQILQSISSVPQKYCGCVVWPMHGEREVLPSEMFSSMVEVEFEGRKFPAPIGYDTYLRSLYGEYEKDPPKEKQKSHHKFTAYRL